MKKLSFQKIFCFISILFIATCCIFYGTRFIKLYLQNKKVEISEKNSLVKVLKENNESNEDFKSVNGENYFTNKTNNNYLMYSNILWRIIKVNGDNSLTIISDNAISHLAYSKDLAFNDSYVFNWLNKTDKDYSGILESSLNDVGNYLVKTSSCTDSLDELSNNPCSKINNDNYFTLLSVVDYLNIGSKDSYLANKEYFYLSNNNTEGKIWYIDDEGKASLSTGNDILGIRPVATIKPNIDYVSGDGTKDKPYVIEKENPLFGSYVKLDDSIWRIYQVNESDYRLMLNDYLKINGNDFKYRYSQSSSYHNDTVSGSIAYYLNNDYLNKLSYKDKIKEVKWSNGYYNSSTNFDYTYALKNKIDSKIALMSIGDIYLNPNTNNYFTMTGASDRSSQVYVINDNKKIYPKGIYNELNVIPTISIDKKLLTKGNGTKEAPFEME